MARDYRRRKVCLFCVDRIGYIDWKDERRISRYVTDRGKIVPRRISGLCAKHQRQLTSAVKRGRHLAVLPFTSEQFR